MCNMAVWLNNFGSGASFFLISDKGEEPQIVVADAILENVNMCNKYPGGIVSVLLYTAQGILILIKGNV